MDAAAIIRQARDVGVRIFFHDDRLHFGPAELTPEWLRREIADHRDDLVAALCPNLSPRFDSAGDETSWASAGYEWPDESLAVRSLFTPPPDPPREIPELARIYVVIGDWLAVEETPRGPIPSEATQWTYEGAPNWWPASPWPWQVQLSKASEDAKRKRKKNKVPRLQRLRRVDRDRVEDFRASRNINAGGNHRGDQEVARPSSGWA